MSDASLPVDDLVVRFGELEAIGGVSFAVAPGEVFRLRAATPRRSSSR